MQISTLIFAGYGKFFWTFHLDFPDEKMSISILPQDTSHRRPFPARFPQSSTPSWEFLWCCSACPTSAISWRAHLGDLSMNFPINFTSKSNLATLNASKLPRRRQNFPRLFKFSTSQVPSTPNRPTDKHFEFHFAKLNFMQPVMRS